MNKNNQGRIIIRKHSVDLNVNQSKSIKQLNNRIKKTLKGSKHAITVINKHSSCKVLNFLPKGKL